MNGTQKWKIWRWLLANGYASGKLNVLPKTHKLEKLLKAVPANRMDEALRGLSKDQMPPIPPSRPVVAPKPKRPLKIDPSWTKNARELFFASDAWRSLRYQALKMGNGRCCLCGASAFSGAVLHVDHIKPASLYPELRLDLSNLQVLCADCNLGKSNKDETDWRQGPTKPKVILQKKK